MLETFLSSSVIQGRFLSLSLGVLLSIVMSSWQSDCQERLLVVVTPVNMQATQCHSVTPPPPWPARDYGDCESNVVTLCDSETETDDRPLRSQWRGAPTSDDKDGRASTDTDRWQHWSLILSPGLKLPICDLHTCVLQNVSLQPKLSLKGILVKYFIVYILPRT